MPRARFWIVVQSHTDILASLLACHQVEHRGSKVNHCDRRHISALGLSRSPATRPRWVQARLAELLSRGSSSAI